MKIGLTAILVTVALALPAQGIQIDFETTPSGAVSVDNAALLRFDSYSVGSVNVSFGFDTNLDGTVDTDGLFEHIGDEGAGFPGPNGFSSSFGIDTAAPGFEAQLGTWFLRSPDDVPATVSLLAFGGLLLLRRRRRRSGSWNTDTAAFSLPRPVLFMGGAWGMMHRA